MNDDALTLRTVPMNAHDNKLLLAFVLDALQEKHCTILRHGSPDFVPFRISFETPQKGRAKLVVYAFRANLVSANHESEANTFYMKHPRRGSGLRERPPDPVGPYITLLLAIDSKQEIAVSFDPVLTAANAPRGPCIITHKDVAIVRRNGWAVWEWEPEEGCLQAVIGVRHDLLYDAVRFEAIAAGLDQGHRALIAERFPWGTQGVGSGHARAG
jgi:hypothetical protein